MIYHVYIDHAVDGEPAIVLLDREPLRWLGRRKYEAYGRCYYVYSVRRVADSLLIEVGRAVERKERGHE